MDREWTNRVAVWLEELKNHFYKELGVVELDGFVTKERLSPAEALRRPFRPMPEGTAWGAKWEYGWFRGQIVLPDAAAARRIVLRLEPGGESAVYINGVIAGAKDREHGEILLSERGAPGRSFLVAAESYAGHGPRLENMPPVPPGRVAIPEPGPTQVKVGKSTFGLWEEEAYQLWLDLDTLYQVRRNTNRNSLRAMEIDRALKDFTLIVDFEVPDQDRLATFTACRRKLAPFLACVNGSTAPTMYIFGQSHLDLAWLWPWAETGRKCARTLSTQVALMDAYPEYRFLLTQPPVYLALKENHPELYERVKEKVKAGQIIPEGGMWVEADTNIPGGESLIRQFIYGKRFFREEFEVDSELAWLPDVFGFTAALPQIMKGCEIKYFVTKKLYDTYNGGDPFPYNIFVWEGLDGSRVLAHLIRKSNSPIDPQTLIGRWEIDRRQQEDIAAFMFPFGYGDGGGGPVRDHLEYVRRMRDLEGVPRTRYCHPVEFFREIEESGPPEKRYVGELYYQAHRGTYTSQAATKRANRECEIALREAELWAAAAGKIGVFPYPGGDLEKAWKMVLFNQFHDIIAGASIRRVHEEAEAEYGEALELAQAVKRAAVSVLAPHPAAGLTVFNSLSWSRRELVELPRGIAAVADSDGGALPVQEIEGRVYAEVAVPSCGWVSLKAAERGAECPNTLRVNEALLENEFLRVEFNDRGEITGIFDKVAGMELAAGPCNSFKMYQDVPARYDAWDIDSMYERLPVELSGKASVVVLCAGPLQAAIRIERNLHDSVLTQVVSLRRNSRRVEFHTRIDWRENHKLLKVAFPIAIHADEAYQEIQFGHVRRPTHRSRRYDADRFEVCNHKWTAVAESNRGFAVLNDCKYGVDVHDGSINLTLLKAALAPDMLADRGMQEFTYAFYVWNGSFYGSNVVREAYELNYPVFAAGGSAGERSLFSLDEANVLIETVKYAEDGSGDLIVRLYEAKRSTVRSLLTTSLPVVKAQEANMLEKAEKDLVVVEGKIALEFRPFEIKTIRLSF